MNDSTKDATYPTITDPDSEANWRATLAQLPPRTRYYALAPIAIGKPEVESFSNYAVRLASAHSVGIIDLARDLKLETRESPNRLANTPANAFNGGVATSLWLAALEEATNIQALQFMTMLPYEGLVSYYRSFHRFRHWCPSCYEDSRKPSKVTYDPLLWSISSVEICPTHLVVLENSCLGCGRQMRSLSAFSRAGYCSHCGTWLGRVQIADQIRADESDRRIWYAKAVGSLFSIGPQLADASTAAIFTDNWRASLDIAMKRFHKAVLQGYGISPSVRDRMLDGPPVLDVLLRLCFGLKIRVESLIDENFAPDHFVPQLTQAMKGIELPRSPISRTELSGLLKEALNEESAPSLAELAGRWGYSGPNRLRMVDSELCKGITKRNRQAQDNARPWLAMTQEKIQKAKTLLKAALYEDSPDRCGAIAKQVGCVADTLRARFPDLCTSVDRKIHEVKQSRLTKAQQLLETAFTLNPVPSLHALARTAGYRCSTSLKQNFPEPCARLLELARVQRSEKRTEITLKLESYLCETPPPTVRAITRRLQLSEATLAESYCDLMAQLANRSKKYKSESAALRRAQVYAEVKQIVETDLRNGRTTAYGARLRTLISNDCPKSWTLLWKALQAARQSSNRHDPIFLSQP